MLSYQVSFHIKIQTLILGIPFFGMIYFSEYSHQGLISSLINVEEGTVLIVNGIEKKIVIKLVASLFILWLEDRYSTYLSTKRTINRLTYKLKGKINIFWNTIWFESWTKATIGIRTIMKAWDRENRNESFSFLKVGISVILLHESIVIKKTKTKTKNYQ